MTKRHNYLNNKDLLKEIHKSKNSFCEYETKEYSDYDFIIDLPKPKKKGGKVKIEHPDSQEYKKQNDKRRKKCLTKDTITKAKAARAARLSTQKYEEAKKNSQTKVKRASFHIKPDEIPVEDLIIRFHTYEHIPLTPDRKDNPSTDLDYHELINFTPFIHYKFVTLDGVVVGVREVGRSHSKNGAFSSTHGSITNNLAQMFMLLTDKYAQKHNWRGYTYVDEMKGSALLQLTDTGLQFNEARSDNPFSFLTTLLKNAFLRVLLKEKKQQDIRDDLIIESGNTPSNTRQLDDDEFVIISSMKKHNTMDDL